MYDTDHSGVLSSNTVLTILKDFHVGRATHTLISKM